MKELKILQENEEEVERLKSELDEQKEAAQSECESAAADHKLQLDKQVEATAYHESLCEELRQHLEDERAERTAELERAVEAKVLLVLKLTVSLFGVCWSRLSC